MFPLAIALSLLASTPSFATTDHFGTNYLLTSNIVGPAFYSAFTWEAIADPTHGRVNYVDEFTSIKRNLTYASFDTFILQADHKTVLDADGPGRDSVRIISRKAYTQHIAVFDVRHMPEGCGTWPAIWETKGQNWPSGGEVDIMEGVNNQSPNAATLHTTEGCTMPASRLQTGTAGQLDCNYLVNYNTGCTVKFPTTQSYGPDFNANGGGWFVMERSLDAISVWFWPRNDPWVPWEIKFGGLKLNSRFWGPPTAYFPNTSCDLAKYFAENNIIINLTFCGDWAGNAYGQSGCPSTCVDFVNNNPTAFRGAYFDFAAVRVYEPTYF
ncbi:glycoside hydrolase family 16 protein [Hebeloma cylindrosporum]|uniref:Glycoside hydrolase family 16 protein n=1 Tax=Hebeloma cylindrosporum TaxID=76867 RepID=A0A0C2XHP1_HEBCY|nr:glycoside hydrolase family 16 protein [Hebeloma cylindrosporum h7]